MRNKIYALIITVTLFLSMNGITKAAENERLKVGTIQFSQLKELPEEFLLVLLPKIFQVRKVSFLILTYIQKISHFLS